MGEPEAWLRGPIEGIDSYLMPVAHALVQAREDLIGVARSVPSERLWAHPGTGASVGFHIRHAAGALDRLLCYARGAELSPSIVAAAKTEKEDSPDVDAAALVAELNRAVNAALLQLKATKREMLLEPRQVGKAKLPSTALGLLFHAAEHATRHAGQAITAAKALEQRA